MYGHEKIDEIRGSPQRVLAAIDEYGRTKKYLMNVGDDKGKIVCDLIRKHKPNTLVELGGYVGYSAVLFGDAVRQAGGKRLFSLEFNPEFAAVIMSLVDLAGLSDIVKVHVGSSANSIKRLHAAGLLSHIDMMFLDHSKPAYTTDLKLCESLKIVGPGSVLAADNCVKPGNPPYLRYVRSTVEEKRKALELGDAANDDKAGLSEKYGYLFQDAVSEKKLGSTEKGNPNLVYDSKRIDSFEPTGIPVSTLLMAWKSLIC